MSIEEWFFFCLSLIWLLEFVLFRGARHSGDSHSIEQKSYYLILLSIIATVIGCLIIRETSFVIHTPLFITWLSLFIYGTGIFLRYWSMLTLKHEFTRHVQVSADKKLVSHGPYRSMRHPLYTALIVCMVGLSCYLASWVGLLFTLLLIIPSILIRIKLEEAMLTEALGETYDEWKRQRWILMPWIY